MGSIFLTWLADELRGAGLAVREYSGWQTRARSSGGYDANPLCVMEHHTASGSSWDGQRDADYIATGADVAPLSNLYIDRTALVWVLAAGATNTNGKGQAMTFSRGTVPADGMNTRAVGIECGNNGVGEPWPQAQIDALIATANAVNRRLGNQPTDVAGHVHYAPGRKIDPATANAVQGPWRPRSCNSSGSWDLDDMRAEHARRAATPPPTPTPEDDDMATAPALWQMNDAGAIYAVYMNGASPLGYKVWLPSGDAMRAFQQLATINGWPTAVNVQTNPDMFRAFGPVLGPIPDGYDAWGLRE